MHVFRTVTHFSRALIIGLVLSGLVLLFFINPAESVFVPKCLFKITTGLDCPACGSQRAIHQLLHLHVAEAFLLNPFLLVALPYAFAIMLVTWFDPQKKLIALKKICHNRKVVLAYIVLFMVWWIVRNIPFWTHFVDSILS